MNFIARRCSIYVLLTLSRGQALVVSFYKLLDSRIGSWNDICSNWKIETTHQCEPKSYPSIYSDFFAKKRLLLRAIFLEVAYFMDPNTRPHRKMFMCLAKIWLGCCCSLDDLNVLRCWFILIPGVTLRWLSRHKLSPVNIYIYIYIYLVATCTKMCWANLTNDPCSPLFIIIFFLQPF